MKNYKFIKSLFELFIPKSEIFKRAFLLLDKIYGNKGLFGQAYIEYLHSYIEIAYAFSTCYNLYTDEAMIKFLTSLQKCHFFTTDIYLDDMQIINQDICDVLNQIFESAVVVHQDIQRYFYYCRVCDSFHFSYLIGSDVYIIKPIKPEND